MNILHKWKTLDWDFIEQSIFRLQVKIYQAASINNLEKLHISQTRLIKSPIARILVITLLTETTISTSLQSNRKIGKITAFKQLLVEKSLAAFSKNNRTSDIKEVLVYLALAPQWEAYYSRSKMQHWPFSYSAKSILQSYISSNSNWALCIKLKNFSLNNSNNLIKKANACYLIEDFIRRFCKKGSVNFLKKISFINILLLKITLYKFPLEILNNLSREKKYQVSNNRLVYFWVYNEVLILHSHRDTLHFLKLKLGSILSDLGLVFNNEDLRIVNTITFLKKNSLPLTFLRGIVFQKTWLINKCGANKKRSNFNRYLIAATDEKKIHKIAVRKLIRGSRGIKPSSLIKKLNILIKSWAYSKKEYFSRSVFLELDRFLSLHLWHWAKKRHPNLSNTAIKKKYWNQFNLGRLVFGLKSSRKQSTNIRLLSYLEIKKQRKQRYLGEKSLSVLVERSLLPVMYYDN
nr:hypothetical protein [Chroomonas debatzensis]